MTGFKKAQRHQAKLRIAITGPSGAGKTYSALLLASGIGKRVALIDTENHSASLYADKFSFDTLEIDPPYTIQKYVQAIELAEKEGYDVVVVDSLSHAWAGEGGLLEKKDSLDKRGGNSYTNWSGITKEHELFKSRLLTCRAHLITTMRSKQEYIIDTSGGKAVPKKVGLAPIQRDGMEYEFTVVFDVGIDHSAQVSKDRTGLFDGQLIPISKKTGETLMTWLGGAEPEYVHAVAPGESSIKVTEAQLRLLFVKTKERGWTDSDLKSYCMSQFNVASRKDLDWLQFEKLLKHIESSPKVKAAVPSPNANGNAGGERVQELS
jgi:hypothetical protein